MKRLLLKFGLLGLVLCLDLVRWPGLWAETGLLSFLRIPPVFAILTLAMVAAALVRSGVVRWAYAVVLGAGTTVIHGFQLSAGTSTTYFDFVTTVDARSALPDAMALYGPALALALAAGIVMAVAIGLKPPPVRRWTGRAAVVLPLVVALGLTAFLVERQGQIRGVPAGWKGVGFAGLYLIDRLHGIGGERRAVEIARSRPPIADDIVLVVDESVSANYLDINAPGGARTGLAQPVPGWSITNFGIAAAITNCSMQSNVALRFGATRDAFQENVATAPSIWSYAQAAGMRTVYLYGQRGGENENYVTDDERLDIDDQLYFRDVALVDRDHRIAEEIVDRINNSVPEFILVNKLGTHFPLTGLYPAGEGPFRPEAEIEALSKDADFWRLYRNNYRNAIGWSVAGFFERIFAGVDANGPGAVVIYTSDHGQTFYEHEAPGNVTHCRVSDVAMEEGAVPLVIATTGLAQVPDWSAVLPSRFDGSSQYQLFPTMLELMGYDPAQVRSTYGPTLASDEPDPMEFGVRMLLRLGEEPDWVRLVPDEVFRPQDAP